MTFLVACIVCAVAYSLTMIWIARKIKDTADARSSDWFEDPPEPERDDDV